MGRDRREEWHERETQPMDRRRRRDDSDEFERTRSAGPGWWARNWKIVVAAWITVGQLAYAGSKNFLRDQDMHIPAARIVTALAIMSFGAAVFWLVSTWANDRETRGGRA